MIQDPNNPVDPELDEAIHIYRAFMEEIKVRLGALDRAVAAVKSNANAPHAFLDCEFGFLQLRLIIELVALAMIIIRKPTGLSDELLNSWSARRALTDLIKQNYLSFPRPAVVDRKPNGEISVNISGKPSITGRGLQRIYNKIGRIMHRGPIIHIIGQGKTYDMDALIRWAGNVRKLLAHHAILDPDQGLALITHLTSGPDDSVVVTLAKSDGPFVFEPQQAG